MEVFINEISTEPTHTVINNLQKKGKPHVREFADETYNPGYERWGLTAKERRWHMQQTYGPTRCDVDKHKAKDWSS